LCNGNTIYFRIYRSSSSRRVFDTIVLLFVPYCPRYYRLTTKIDLIGSWQMVISKIEIGWCASSAQLWDAYFFKYNSNIILLSMTQIQTILLEYCLSSVHMFYQLSMHRVPMYYILLRNFIGFLDCNIDLCTYVQCTSYYILSIVAAICRLVRHVETAPPSRREQILFFSLLYHAPFYFEIHTHV